MDKIRPEDSDPYKDLSVATNIEPLKKVKGIYALSPFEFALYLTIKLHS